ncbi:MAG: hypothetical protein QM664_15135 [Flavihumibacter sp.]
MKCTGFAILLFISFTAAAQWSPPLQLLKKQLQEKHYTDSTAGRNPLYAKTGLNYLQPLYKPLLSLPDDARKHANLDVAGTAVVFRFAGDHATAIRLASAYYDSLPAAAYRDIDRYVDTLRTPDLVPAAGLILQKAAGGRVVMINESPAYAQQTAFSLSLLEGLHQLGYRYLAMESLNSRADRNTQSLDLRTGYQAAEPVTGELIRKALSLGYVLLPYEDSSQHGGSGRDAIQAATLASLFKHDSAAKILVIATGAHISETSGSGYTPMAVFFKRFTGIDPLTIDQVEMGEGSAFEYGRYFYRRWQQKKRNDAAVIASIAGKPLSLLEADQYDLQVIHPPTTWKNRRPQWLSFDGKRRMYAVRPTEKNLFLAQAYYLDETKEKNLQVLVPADQTYIADEDGYYWLYLFPGKYKLVLRDTRYNLLSEKEIEVK